MPKIESAIPILLICWALSAACGSEPTDPDGSALCGRQIDYSTETEQSHRIVLTRWAPCGNEYKNPPLLLCPGLPLNTHSYEYLARYLADGGVDAWVVDYWGRGKSAASPDEQEVVAKRSIDEIIHDDVPAALDLVRSVTGQDTVFIGGISEGGMIALAVMEFYPERVRGGVALAPTMIVGAVSPMLEALWEVPFLNMFLPSNYLPRQDTILPMESFVGGLMQFFPPPERKAILQSNLMGFLYNSANVGIDRIEDLLQEGISDIPFNEWIQFLRGAGIFASSGVHSFEGSGFYRDHGWVNYASEVIRINKPCLLTAGTADLIAPPQNVEKIFERMTRCPDKTLLRLDHASGCRLDYGHVDQILGSLTQKEVFEPILGWIFDHS